MLPHAHSKHRAPAPFRHTSHAYLNICNTSIRERKNLLMTATSPTQPGSDARMPTFITPAFITPISCAHNSSGRKPRVSRRNILRFALTALSTFIPALDPADAGPTRDWQPEQLCGSCAGCGTQTCTFCDGTGIFNVDDSFVLQNHVCPNCSGVGTVKCPACIGLGLAHIKGILRNAARDGSLRMLRDGSYEILDCSAFPACDLYGAERRSLP